KLTNYGNKFVIGFTSQYSLRTYGYIGIAIAAHFDTNVTIITQSTSSVPLNVAIHMKEGDFLEYGLPRSLRMQGIQNNGIQVSSTMNISIECFNYYTGGDGYLALPTDALGVTYVVASYTPYNSVARAKIGIVSIHDETTILIQPIKNAVIEIGGTAYTHAGPIHVFLGKLQSMQVTSESDLSGTMIFASKPVSVVCGVDLGIPGGTGSYDRLESFLLPVTQWGKQYILTTVGSTNKKQGDIFRIFAFENSTVVHSAYWIKVLLSGTYTELILGENLTSFVNCNKPCQVVQYIRGETIGSKKADTSMIVLPSIKQFKSYYRVLCSHISGFYSSATITIEERLTNGLFLNGVKMSYLNWIKISGTKYVWTVVGMPGTKLATFYHSSRDGNFGLLVYGWNGDNSYAYPGGFTFQHYSTDLKCLIFLNDLIESGRLFQCLVAR
ncbi:Hypothetical predicted protein, partial [Paramuricea clavata]